MCRLRLHAGRGAARDAARQSGGEAENQTFRTAQWRQSGDAAKGWTMQVRSETPTEFAARLSEDIAGRPEFYFARKEIPRLSSDIEEFRAELWQQQQAIREAQKNGRWYRNPAQCCTMGRCSYLDICHAGIHADAPPAGFIRVENVHPELIGD